MWLQSVVDVRDVNDYKAARDRDASAYASTAAFEHDKNLRDLQAKRSNALLAVLRWTAEAALATCDGAPSDDLAAAVRDHRCAEENVAICEAQHMCPGRRPKQQ